MQSQQVKSATSPSSFMSALIRSVVWGTLMVCAGVLLVLIGAGAFLAYRITTAGDNVENVTPASYLLELQECEFY